MLDALDEHVETYVDESPDSPLFPGEAGGVISDDWFKKTWTVARKSVGLPTVRFHDLRHTAGTLATMYRDRRYKLVVYHHNPQAGELYDLDADLKPTSSRYLGDAEAVKARAEAVARQAEAKQ